MSLMSQRFCENCGARLQAGTRFCDECGVPVGAIAGRPARSQPPVARPTGAAPAAAASPARTRPAPSSGRWSARLLLIALVAGAGWWWMGRSTPHAPETPTGSMAPPQAEAPLPDPAAPQPMADIAPDATRADLDRPLVAPAPPAPAPEADPALPAARELADMIVWIQKEPWVRALAATMPRGVTLSLDAEPYDAEGWSSVSLRENHAPDSGFDPNVSPMLGLFRVARADRRIEWMEPVSGDYVALAEFIKAQGLTVPDASPAPAPAPQPMPGIAPDATRAVLDRPLVAPAPPAAAPAGKGAPGIIAGDFESAAPPIPDRDMAVIVADPMNPGNHVARITGPDEMSFTLPVELPEGTPEVAVKLKLLHPESTKLIPFPDGQGPEGIRLRVRLLNELGNSVIRDAVVRPTGMWRDLEYIFYDLPKKVVQVSVEAIWMEGPIYVDEVRFTTA